MCYNIELSIVKNIVLLILKHNNKLFTIYEQKNEISKLLNHQQTADERTREKDKQKQKDKSKLNASNGDHERRHAVPVASRELSLERGPQVRRRQLDWSSVHLP